MTVVQSLPFGKKILFAAGQVGWSLASFAVGNLLVYFYMPPETSAGAVFPTYIFPGVIFGVLTVIGIISALARLFDAVSNPVIAHLSDRSRSRWGRRRVFMLIAALPFAFFAFLVFFPISQLSLQDQTLASSWGNIWWLSACIILFYISFVMYVTPYTALMSELGHSPKERLFLATLISLAWALGFAIGNFVYFFQGAFEKGFGMSSTQAFQAVLAIFSIVSFVLMMLPALFIDEKKYVHSHGSSERLLPALRASLANRNFVRFLSSELFYFVCLTIMQMGMVFFVTVLLGLEKEFVSLLMSIMFLVSFAWYPVVTATANRFGKKTVMICGFAIFCVVFLVCAAMGLFPIEYHLQAIIVVVLAAIPMAIFGILPNAIVADLAEEDGKKTGHFKAGIFFGIRTFEMNLGISLGNILFPSLLTLGKTVDNPTGVRIAACGATFLCLVGLLIFAHYREKEVLASLG